MLVKLKICIVEVCFQKSHEFPFQNFLADFFINCFAENPLNDKPMTAKTAAERVAVSLLLIILRTPDPFTSEVI